MSSTAEELAEERVENVDPASGPPPVKRMPTPREIRRGLNSYVIGQSNVKVALSVGVYNHYKRIFVAEAQAAAESRKANRDNQEEYFPLGGDGGGNKLAAKFKLSMQALRNLFPVETASGRSASMSQDSPSPQPGIKIA